MINSERLAAIREGLTVRTGATISQDQLVDDYISFVVTGKPEPSMAIIKAVDFLELVNSIMEVSYGKE